MSTWHRYAFISYNHRDMKMAKWLHRKLESYKLPTEIHNEFEDSKYLRPVFRDREDLNTGVLSDELRKHLESSKFLIVVCSPCSAKSEWVNNEIRAFIEWGRWEYIIPLIIDGTPFSGDDSECFPPAILDYVRQHPKRELLGINIDEIGRDKAFVRVVSRMLGVSFDELWNRHKRERHKRILAWSISMPIALALLYYLIVPVKLIVSVCDDEHHLPLPDDVILTVGHAEYPLASLDTSVIIQKLPGYLRLQKLPISIHATYYEPVNAEIRLPIGTTLRHPVALTRDSTFSIFAGHIISGGGLPVADASVVIGDSVSHSDAQGYFKIVFSTQEQTETKSVLIRKDGMKNIFREDEWPLSQLQYVMHPVE